MKAAVVLGQGRAPVYADFTEPEPAAGEARIAVTAAAISQVTKSRASGHTIVQPASSRSWPASTAWGGSTTAHASISSCRARPTGRWPNARWRRGRGVCLFPMISTM